MSPSAVVSAATQHNVDAVSIFQPYQAQTIQALNTNASELSGGTYHQHSLFLATQQRSPTDYTEFLDSRFLKPSG